MTSVASIYFRSWLIYIYFVGLISFLSRYVFYESFLFDRILSFIVAIVFFVIVLFKKRNYVSKCETTYYCCIQLFLLSYILLQTSYPYFAPLLFFATSFAVCYVAANCSLLVTRKDIDLARKLFYITIFILFLFLVIDVGSFQQENRFVGFFASPTTFATWLTCLFVLSNLERFGGRYDGNALNLFITFALLGYFVLISGTRVNLIFVLTLALMFSRKFCLFLSKRYIRALIIVAFTLCIFLIYPVYDFLMVNVPSDVVVSRFEGGQDTSYGLRFALFSTVSESISESGLRGLFFGNGSESSRMPIIEKWGEDLFPHNDILRIIHDFGVIVAIIFIITLSIIGSKSMPSFVLTLLYVVSFVHNMIYTHYMIALIIIFSNSRFENKKFETIR